MEASMQVPTSLLDEEASFDSFGIDERLLRAISKMGFAKPTLIQSSAIPLALQGKDIVARARTGSGKTAAYSIPILQSLLLDTQKEPGVKALILVPTSELTEQVKAHFKTISQYCPTLNIYSIAADVPATEQIPRLKEKPDILIATPGRLAFHLNHNNISLDILKVIVVDEADLVLSYGYEDDLRTIIKYIPKICQAFLMSATLSPEVESLKQLMLHTPAILKLEEAPEIEAKLTEYFVKCPERDKFLVIYALIRLKIISGKAIIFVNDIDRCYALKLFLERFSINSAVLNAELPQNSRYHIVQEFNKGIFDYLIATDENFHEDDDDDDEGDNDEANKKSETEPKKKKQKIKKDKEYGVSRGVDFKRVQAVVNFDVPLSTKNYVHRVGRTARGGASGTALSFVHPGEEEMFNKIQQKRADSGSTIQPYKLNLKVLEGLRYRVEDILRSVTRIKIRDARLAELKHEILNSEKLKTHFEEHPEELQLLKHDKPLQQAKVMPHLKHLPNYIIPTAQLQQTQQSNSLSDGHHGRKKRKRRGGKDDPLKTFSAKNAFMSPDDSKKDKFKKQRGFKNRKKNFKSKDDI